MKGLGAWKILGLAAAFLPLEIGGGVETSFAQAAIDWNKTAYDYRGQNGQRFTFECAAVPEVPFFLSVWGTDVYADESSICKAAAHFGVIGIAGGRVTIEIRPGQNSYSGTTRNGITTSSYGVAFGSFAVLPAGTEGNLPPLPTPNPAPTPTPTSTPTSIPTSIPTGGPTGTPSPGGNSSVGELVIDEIEGQPLDRKVDDPAENAIDGDLNTFTWTTEEFNTISPSYLAIAFEDAEVVNRLRLWKQNAGGGGENVKDLEIQFTTDTGPLSTRTWQTVTGLGTGLADGTEELTAEEVSSLGFVVGDVHDSPSGEGWASLTFDPLVATGLRIAFRNPGGPFGGCDPQNLPSDCNHYRVGEIEAYNDPIEIEG